MTSVKDRLKLFETNSSPIKPKSNFDFVTDSKKLSDTNSKSELKADTNFCANNEAFIKPEAVLNGEIAIEKSKSLSEQKIIDCKLSNGNQNFTYTNVAQNESLEINIDTQNMTVKSDIKDNSETSIEKKSIQNVDIENKVLTDDVIDEMPLSDTHKESEDSVNINIDNTATIDESSDTDSIENLTFEYFGSVYDLPGLENFIFKTDELDLMTVIDETDFIKETKDSFDDNIKVAEIDNDHTELDVKDTVADNNSLKRTYSKKLIEEIFNTSVWRNSLNYSDDFIFTPVVETNSEIEVNVNERLVDLNSSSNSIGDEGRKYSQSFSTKHTKRSIFSGIFKSKRGRKKSLDKRQSVELSSNILEKSTETSKQDEEDTESQTKVTKTPLNSIFNRDWLNSLGEGIKKKALVMSELRKVFSGKGKYSKKY